MAVLPESSEKARKWQDSYEPPYPLLADSAKELGEKFDQPTRFGALGNLHDMIGKMPEALVIDVTGADPEVRFIHKGTSPGDRPTIDELLAEVRSIDP